MEHEDSMRKDIEEESSRIKECVSGMKKELLHNEIIEDQVSNLYSERATSARLFLAAKSIQYKYKFCLETLNFDFWLIILLIFYFSARKNRAINTVNDVKAPNVHIEEEGDNTENGKEAKKEEGDLKERSFDRCLKEWAKGPRDVDDLNQAFQKVSYKTNIKWSFHYC